MYTAQSVYFTLYVYQKYNLVRVDHPDNMKRGGFCIYYKESPPV